MGHIPTPSQTVGPFFHFELTTTEHCVPRIAGPLAKGERIWLKFRVLDGNGAPLNDAMLEIWQADAQGKYNHPDDPEAKSVEAGWRGFGRMGTNENGQCEFETIKPGRVPAPGGIQQAPHLNVAVFARGMLKQLYTRIYFAGDTANAEDPVLALVPADRRDTLMARPDPATPNGWLFDVRLQGEAETVFFDV
jgi:protocatechuate 3,4-dioxygenase, alpha subunit